MRIALDTGGTFTDCIFVRGGRLQIVKVPSRPANPAEAIEHALRLVLERCGNPLGEIPLDLTCGTTVGTNALLQRKGGRVTLVTTAGFEDVLEIGRQARPSLYDFFVDRPAPLVPRERRIGLDERIGARGEVVRPLTPAEIRRAVRQVRRARPEAVALCLLFSYLQPRHERALAKALRAAGFDTSVSSEILPEFREFERTATTVINAYLIPVMSCYLAEIESRARTVWSSGTRGVSRNHAGARVRVMQSGGGIASASLAAHEPVRTILSGPAGGVLGAEFVAERAGIRNIISFDMGGTSTDVALLGSGLRTTNESQVAGLPVAVPMLEIHIVGAGGGSLARFDRGGSLRVGPESAGADPGPICYGKGEQPTVTDAHLVLGRFGEAGLLGGSFPLDRERTLRCMERARRPLRSVEELARGIVAVANSVMEKAIRVISLERGHDPRDYTLVAFGGAGGLHACDLAAALEMRGVLIPRFPGGLSALGILRADVVKDVSRTVRQPVASVRSALPRLQRHFRRIEREGTRRMAGEGFPSREIRIERWLDVRYIGQAYELSVPAAGDFAAAFHRAHEQRYGYRDATRPIEIVNVRVRFIGATGKPPWPRIARAAGAPPPHLLRTRCHFQGRSEETIVYDRDNLRAGHRFVGPAIATEYSATTVLPPGWQARVDPCGNLLLARRDKRSPA